MATPEDDKAALVLLVDVLRGFDKDAQVRLIKAALAFLGLADEVQE